MNLRGKAVAWSVSLVLLVMIAGIGPRALAATQYDVVPSLTLSGGYDDNVLFDNSGGDAILRPAVRLEARAFERHWNLFTDARVTSLTYFGAGRTILLGELLAGARARLGRDWRVGFRGRMRTSDDPLGLAQFGVLGVEGRTFAWKGDADAELRLSARNRLRFDGTFQGVSFFEPVYAGDAGASAGLAASFVRRERRDFDWRLAVESRAFFGRDDQAFAVGGVPGVRLRLARRTFLDVSAGVLALVEKSEAEPVGIGRLRLEREGRGWGGGLALAKDLTVPAGRFGVLSSQLAEGIVRWGNRRFETRARAGFYRSRGNQHAWASGWGAEAEAFVQLGGPFWAGLTAMRFSRLASEAEPAISRDAVYLRIDVTGGRP